MMNERVHYKRDAKESISINETAQLLTIVDSDSDEEKEGIISNDHTHTVKPLPVENPLPPALPQNTVVVYIKEGVRSQYYRNRHSKPNNHFVLALISCLCCFPVGVAALLRSYQVDHYYSAGNLEKARQCASDTRHLSNKSITVGCILYSSILAFLLTAAIIVIILPKPNQYY